MKHLRHTSIPLKQLISRSNLILLFLTLLLGAIFLNAIITVGGVFSGQYTFAGLRFILHFFAISLYIFPVLYWLNPNYLSKAKYATYALGCILLLILGNSLRFAVDFVLVREESYSLLINQSAANAILGNLASAGILIDGKYQPIYYWGMIAGSLITIGSVITSGMAVQWYDRIVMYTNQLEHNISYLKGQMAPHFLANSINNIYNMVLRKGEGIDIALIKQAELMRYFLDDGKEDRITLKKEIAFIESYITFHQLTSPYGISINFHRLDDYHLLHYIEIPPMLFEPFIGNAFKHGNALHHEDGFIHISLTTNAKYLIFDIFNTKDNATYSPCLHASTKKGIGLKNVQERLQMIFPNAHVLHIDNNHPSLFKIQLKIELEALVV